MLTRICEEKILQINNHVVLEQEVCIGLNYYGFQFSDSKLNVCSNDLVAFCNHVRYFLHLKYFFFKTFCNLAKIIGKRSWTTLYSSFNIKYIYSSWSCSIFMLFGS